MRPERAAVSMDGPEEGVAQLREMVHEGSKLEQETQ
jgi:hypothetical protein